MRIDFSGDALSVEIHFIEEETNEWATFSHIAESGTASGILGPLVIGDSWDGVVNSVEIVVPSPEMDQNSFMSIFLFNKWVRMPFYL
jgi:hypothetical protein